MFVVESYALAVVLCLVTMLCWGSWANTQKLASKKWQFQLFYWDYSIGVFLFALGFALTLGSTGDAGRSFLSDLSQADRGALFSALLGGIIFNLSNILLVAAIDIAGMAVAFPIGVGLALVLGVVTNYIATPVGNPSVLFGGVSLVVLAIVLSATAYRRLAGKGRETSGKGIALSVVAGLLMGFFYRFVAASMFDIHFDAGQLIVNAESGKLSPYTALVVFSAGLLLSSIVWNSRVMVRPFVGDPVPFSDYFRKGSPQLHLIGVLGGVIWSLGMSLSIIASGAAGDTFNGALAVALAEGLPIEMAVPFATAAAALSVTKLGAQSSIPQRAAVDTLIAGMEKV